MFGKERNQKTQGASYEARVVRNRAPSRASRRAPRNSPPRRGVLLLVVLSVLVLFLMIGTAFVISAKHSEKAGKAGYKGAVRTATEASQGKLLDEVILQLVRDTNSLSSVLRTHSLLGDMYGNDGFRSQIPLPETNLAALLSGQTPAIPVPLPNPAPQETVEFTVRWPSVGSGASLQYNVTGGQILEFDLVKFQDQYGNVGSAATQSSIDNAYNGLVLTFVNGPLRGQSTRIVGSIHQGNWLTLRIMAVPMPDGSRLPDTDAALTELLAQSEVMINGRPFNGTGAGFNPYAAAGAPKLNATEIVRLPAGPLPVPIALTPNLISFAGEMELPNAPAPTPVATHFKLYNPPISYAGLFDLIGRGGADESYDAPDFQNMALALVPGADKLSEIGTPPVLADSNGNPMVIPSFHRPELINYWANFGPFAPATPGDLLTSSFSYSPLMLRKVLLRPNWIDHPNFTGSNPEIALHQAAFAAALAANPDLANNQNAKTEAGRLLTRMVYGPWDVDNDNDGVRDSVWLDVGLPVMSLPNGKRVKPLAALLVMDLDGRLNVNAHGTVELAEVPPFGDVLDEVILADGTTESDDTARGTGYGPADISLEIAIGNDFRALLAGRTFTINGRDVFFPGRYGIDRPDVYRPGREESFDLQSQLTMAGWPHWADGRPIDGSSNRLVSNFVTPPDLRARYGVGLNYFGQPVFEATLQNELDRTQPAKNLVVDSPYELNLSQKTAEGVQFASDGAQSYTAADAPFSIAELERVLRVYDFDAGKLPPRLTYLAGIQHPSGSPTFGLTDRLKLTTDSFDLPVPNFSMPRELEPLLTTTPARRLPRSAAELFEMRVRAVLFKNDSARKFPAPLTGDADNDQVSDADEVRNILRRIVAPELADGLRLNINRPFGNGKDDNDNGVVDEPGETDGPLWDFIKNSSLTSAEQKFEDARFPPAATEFVPDTLPATDPNFKANGIQTPVDHRHLLARHLYVLALTLTAEPDYGTAATPPDDERQLARRLAQWAVNAVDFRDADAMMTAFEYDVNPFDGWDVDGWISDTMQAPGLDGQYGTNDDVVAAAPLDDRTKPFRGVVWGVERPELLITETMAWHDRRTDDETNEEVDPDETEVDQQQESGATYDEGDKKDGSYDQARRPRGAFFVELYNPWPAAPAANADTHHVSTGKDIGVDPSAYVRDPSDPTKGSPVWRLAIYRRTSQQQQALQEQKGQTVQGAFIDPDDPDADPAKPNDQKHPVPVIDRTVYFSGFDPDYGPADGVAFYNNSQSDPATAVRSVRPGRYLVVGSGEDRDGDDVYEAPLGDPTGVDLTPEQVRARQRRMELRPVPAGGISPLRLVKGGNPDPRFPRIPNDPEPIDDRAWMCDVAIIDQPRRLTISEPPRGYPDSMKVYGLGSLWQESATATEEGSEGAYVHAESKNPLPIDVPLDDNRDVRPDLDAPLAIGAYRHFRQVCLQRLANPLLPWNPEPAPGPNPSANGHKPDLPVNPYRTVDSSSANLTVFNGRNAGEPVVTSGEVKDNPMDGAKVQPGPAPKDEAYFGSLERGWAYDLANHTKNKPDQANLWNPEDIGRRISKKARDNDQYFRLVPDFTMGYLNKAFDYADNAFNQDAQFRRPTVPKPDPDNPGAIVPKSQPFPWFTWNNRPFISGNELLLAPQWRSSQVLRRFSMRIDDDLSQELEVPKSPTPYETPVEAEEEDQQQPKQGQQGNQQQPQPEFAHLENFFYQDDDPPDGVPNGLYRLLDFVQTPSLFTGAQTWLNPQRFGGAATSFDDPRFNRQPPFNAISEFREPGRINLNTIFGDRFDNDPDVLDYRNDVWDGLFHDFTRRTGDPDKDGVSEPDEAEIHPGPTVRELAASRRGYDGAGDDQMRINAESPTLIANPFRSPDAGDLVPLPGMIRAGVDATLFRSMEGTAGPTASPKGDPLFSAATENLYEEANRNPYFRYRPMTRLANLVTTRSNVYAVWVTIGFFEVEDAPAWANANQANFNNNQALYNRVYPDGYTLSREAGVDTGDTRRIRGFYIIDRSLPAAFEPGADHNVENVIRLRRRIE